MYILKNIKLYTRIYVIFLTCFFLHWFYNDLIIFKMSSLMNSCLSFPERWAAD